MAPPAPSITVTSSAAGRASRIVVSAPGSTRYTVYRIVDGTDVQDEPRFRVRGLVDRTDGAATGYDIDAPQGSTVKYAVVSRDATGTSKTVSTGSVTVPRHGDCLISTGATAAKATMFVEGVSPLTFTARSQVVNVINRRDAVVVADRRQYPAMRLAFWTRDSTEYQTMEDLLYRFPVVCFSPANPRWADSPVAPYLAVRDVTVESVAVERTETPGRLIDARYWQLDVMQVGAPAATLVTDITGW